MKKKVNKKVLVVGKPEKKIKGRPKKKVIKKKRVKRGESLSEKFAVFEQGIQRLKEIKKELSNLDTTGYEEEADSIRKKLNNVAYIPEIEKELIILKKKISRKKGDKRLSIGKLGQRSDKAWIGKIKSLRKRWEKIFHRQEKGYDEKLATEKRKMERKEKKEMKSYKNKLNKKTYKHLAFDVRKLYYERDLKKERDKRRFEEIKERIERERKILLKIREELDSDLRKIKRGDKYYKKSLKKALKKKKKRDKRKKKEKIKIKKKREKDKKKREKIRRKKQKKKK